MSLTSRTTSTSLAALCAGGFLASLWALFQWGELLVARAGGTPFCAISETFNCASVWDSELAKTVHSTTLIPVAGWGLMWGIVAFALPLLALVDPSRKGLGTALRITGLAGVASVLGLAGASIVGGHLCIGCIGTYVVVIGWAALAWTATKSTGFSDVQKGVFWAGGVTVASYLALLWPGMQTPHALGDVGKDAIKNAAAANNNNHDVNNNNNPDAALNGPRNDQGPGPFDGPSTGDPAKDQGLDDLLAQLPPDARQAMSNLLADYEKSPLSPAIPEARALIGERTAPVTIVDWTDPLCPHCAELHEVLDEIRKVAPGSVNVQPHFFPLDGLCNASVQRKGDTGEARCAASKALVCMENEPEKLALAQKLVFENQMALSQGADKLWDVLKPIADRKTLEACMASPETQKKLDDDIDFANKNHLEGTPLVLLNGKEVKPFGPVLYALALTGGKTKAAPLKVLPPPKAMPK